MLDVGDVRLDALGPASPFHGTRSDPNNSSEVLLATVDGVRILLPGDAELEAQRALLASGADLRAEVLKVPHHGSAYSDPAFLAAVHAQVGIISVGRNNDYGHPSPVLLSELARLGVPSQRTDLAGDIAVVAHDHQLSTVAHGTAATPTARGSWPVSAPSRVRTSAFDARMTACPPARSTSISFRIRFRLRCCSWATRNCWSLAPSARSPPRCAGGWVRSTSPSGWVPRSRAPSCTSCSVRRCSANPGWS
jgi:competence protein ComEC